MDGGNPILVLQMQRMGDLVLTFPLLFHLQQSYPSHPIWVVAEKTFYEGLLRLSPQAVYFPWSGVEAIKQQSYHLVINLSHRHEAAELAGAVKAEEKLGLTHAPGGHTYIHGRWQLYRASIVHNNRHNRFHWADLNALDAAPDHRLSGAVWPAPRQPGAQGGRVGLFLGASEPAKRPSAAFWSALLRELLKQDLRPVLLGGPQETDLGREVASLAREPALNLCGKYSVSELFNLGQGLDLLVTPDTGPMHVAAWGGLTTLNLSMGPVHPWETGPYPPGHWVLQSAAACVGCWQCVQPRTICHDAFEPSRIASLARLLMQGRMEQMGRLHVPGQRLFQTGRDGYGLYHLQRWDAGPAPQARQAMDLCWQAWFGYRFGAWPRAEAERAWSELGPAHPALQRFCLRALASLSRRMARSLRQGSPLPESFWSQSPPALRPLTGYLVLLLQNANHSREGFRRALLMLEEIISLAS